jgi:membrane-associated phospholipid phosphatase
MIGIISNWLQEFWPFFLATLPRWFGAWLATLLLLIFAFRALKPRLRTRALSFDKVANRWARGLRYKLQQADAALEPNTPPAERVLLTWFFRFWTNFASAPSLSFFAFAIPIFFFGNLFSEMKIADYEMKVGSASDVFFDQKHWLIPAFCYFGSMGLSYVMKRVFKRVRPVRDKGAFGHALRDASFPSGHSLTAFCFWIPMIASVFLQTQNVAATAVFAIIAILIVALTGLSRFYMAVHWPSDVAGGFIIGAVWLTVFAVVFASWF